MSLNGWDLLLNPERRRNSTGISESRSEFERDFDRILFATPLRRLADKTQVFPLEEHASVRTRLTHSYEVSAIARSIGTDLVARRGHEVGLPETVASVRHVSAALAAIGLVHDLGNPPFGHQGEAAIRRWFQKNQKRVFGNDVSKKLRRDFLQFDGNAQTLRLVTRLQFLGDEFGLNLTYGTLAALLKYTVPFYEADKDAAAAGAHKGGFFASEAAIVDEVWMHAGLQPGQRHPLTYLMEAADDIAYSVIDAEDAVKKDLASYADLEAFLSSGPASGDSMILAVLAQTQAGQTKIVEASDGREFSPGELDALSMQLFRVASISRMVEAATDTFVHQFDAIMSGSLEGELIENSPASALRSELKRFLRRTAFSHRSVLEVELRGSLVIADLMDRFWAAIIDREDRQDPRSARNGPLSAYVYGRISENYRRIFEAGADGLPLRYREAQLLTDMIAGMTDSFALALHQELRAFDAEAATPT